MSSDTQHILASMCSNTFTVTDMHRRLGLLRECVEVALFHESEIPFNEVVITKLQQRGSTGDVAAVTAWADAVFSAFTASTSATKMTALQAAIDELPVLALYIPVVFPDEELALIGQWCRIQCDPSVLLDIHIDPGVVGGCAFVWNDTYHDFSFRRKLAAHPNLITTELSTYAT